MGNRQWQALPPCAVIGELKVLPNLRPYAKRAFLPGSLIVQSLPKLIPRSVKIEAKRSRALELARWSWERKTNSV